MSISELNLARKWRPSTFESIVGQDLTVRLLKNSLFRQQFFPVYLLAGQRGCGKTTTGRVFAAAVNCHKLPDFSQDPQNIIVPCGRCASCDAMKQGMHPDFIEIDAASHTGVDHVRQIIEATSFLPQLGRKKIYLIDEAHMLSKAAFNAFLKILEEPPKTVLFMMATTDAHKIIDTVRSRCFQLFFDPVADTILSNHLAEICTREEIPFNLEGLELVIRESEGSIRDALNIVERVRLAHDQVTKQAVVATFGFIEDNFIIALLETVAANNVHDLLQVLDKHHGAGHSAQLWKKLFECLRSCLVMQHGVKPHAFGSHHESLRRLGAALSVERLVACMEMMYAVEQQFIKTTAQRALIEMVLIKMCMGKSVEHEIVRHNPPIARNTVQKSAQKIVTPSFDYAQDERGVESKSKNPAISHLISKMNPENASSLAHPERSRRMPDEAVSFSQEDAGTERLWLQFVTHVDTLGQPLFASMVKQGRYVSADQAGTCWQVALPKELMFFEDAIEKALPAWKKLLEQLCHKPIDIKFNFTEEKKLPADNLRSTAPAPAIKKPVRAPEQKVSLDVRDPNKWEKTHTLLALFPGTVSEVK